MTAKEMFEELGYELKEYKKNKLVIYESDKFVLKEISMSKIRKEIQICCIKWCGGDGNGYHQYPLFLSLKELKAINKQIEELGWFE